MESVLDPGLRLYTAGGILLFILVLYGNRGKSYGILMNIGMLLLCALAWPIIIIAVGIIVMMNMAKE